VRRGGSWNSVFDVCCCTDRDGLGGPYYIDNLGFRVAFALVVTSKVKL
jgi:hypothetical protein